MGGGSKLSRCPGDTHSPTEATRSTFRAVKPSADPAKPPGQTTSTGSAPRPAAQVEAPPSTRNRCLANAVDCQDSTGAVAFQDSELAALADNVEIGDD